MGVEEWKRVCKVQDLKERCGHKVVVGDQAIALFMCHGQVHAMDNACYHDGASLHPGDIEDLGGRNVVVCPRHAYKIALDNGEGLYIGYDIVNKTKELKSKGVKQKVFPVRVEGNDIFVKI
eukprot:gb/GECH01008224.1/.p1 GENE.gb/GECH01008224.1/~~gb/GECH01008224.1/.p1  ORF type:complete len:121 (+),score=31.88 gb/GECH01008224.1/:1-363(+)